MRAALGFAEFDGASTVEQEDTWLEVEGTIELTKYDGSEMPILKITSWKIIAEPKEPYVYPVYQTHVKRTGSIYNLSQLLLE